MTIDNRIRQEILRRIEGAEAEHNVKVIYACESGSRAWGFASPDSDYDVRFIYAHPADWYLSFDVERRRDVIEYPIVDDIDIGGWDIRKALYLFTRTNGALLEWINSPIRYCEVGSFAEEMRQLAPAVLNDIALKYHYSHMARGNAGDQLARDKVRLKKYFYILRPLLAIRHIESGLGVPPVRFQALLEAVAPRHLKAPVYDLIELKKNTPEIGSGEHIVEIDEFIFSELARHEGVLTGQGRPDIHDTQSTTEALNGIFRAAIASV